TRRGTASQEENSRIHDPGSVPRSQSFVADGRLVSHPFGSTRQPLLAADFRETHYGIYRPKRNYPAVVSCTCRNRGNLAQRMAFRQNGRTPLAQRPSASDVRGNVRAGALRASQRFPSPFVFAAGQWDLLCVLSRILG